MSAPARANHPSFAYASHAVPATGKHVSAVVTPNSSTSTLSQYQQFQHINSAAASGHVALGQRSGTDQKASHIVVLQKHAKPGVLAVHNHGLSAIHHPAAASNPYAGHSSVKYSLPHVVKR